MLGSKLRVLFGLGTVCGVAAMLVLGTGCPPGGPAACTDDAGCDDNNGCTTDTCDVATGVCTNTPACEDDHCIDNACVECIADDECDDGLYCNGEETCGDDGACADGTSPCMEDETCIEDDDECVLDPCEGVVCDDSDVCTDDACDETTGQCVYTNNTAACDDADVCTENDVCADGVCAGTAIEGCCHDDTECGEDEVCVDNVCVTVCTEDADCVPFDDGLYCTGDPVCTDGVCGFSGDPCDVDAGEECVEETDSCTTPGYSVNAGADQIVSPGAAVTLTCTQTDPLGSMSWAQTGGTTVVLSDLGDGTATFTASSLQGDTHEFTCTGWLDANEDGIEDEGETATDDVVVTVEVGPITVIADNRICAIPNASFTGGAAITSNATTTCGPNNPPGLLATAASELVTDPANIILSWSCVSGPDGADDCDYVSFINSSVANNGTVSQYTLSPVNTSYTTLTRSGGTGTVSSMVKPGQWTFRVTATAGSEQASTTAIYTIDAGFDVLSRDASGAAGTMFEDTTGADSTFNLADTSDDFPAEDISSNTTSAVSGIVMARGQLAHRVVAPGATITSDFTALVRTGGAVNFSLRDISGASLGTFISQSSTTVTPASPVATETVTATVTATDADGDNLALGTYQLYAAFDSNVGATHDTAATPTDLVIHVQPDLTGTMVVTSDTLRAATSQTGKTCKYHGGEAISAASADGGDEVTGDIVIACDTDNDGIDELVIFDNQDGEGLADATILWTTADPTDDLIDNLLFNQGLPTVAAIAARTTTIDLDTTCDQDGATADTGGLFISAVCGDYNGDGYVDLVVGTDADIAGGGDTSDGRVALFYHLGGTGGLSSDDRTDQLDDPWDEDGAATGSDNSITINRDTDANAAGWLFGYSLAIGDFSGGTHDDIIIGAPLEDTTNDTSADGNHPGTVYVMQGSGTLIVTNVTVDAPGTPGANEMDQVFEPDNDSDDVFNGAAVALIDWSDGTSGKMDLLVGAPGDTGSADDGRIYLIGGGTSSTSLSEGRVWFGETDDGIGRRLVVCDFDGNGTDDFFTSGVGGTANIVPANGKIYAFMNDLASDQNANLTENTSILEIAGSGSDNIGWRLACGDLNGDGYDDLAYVASGDGTLTEDEVRVVLGSASPGQTLSVAATFDDVNMDQPTDGGDDCGDGCTAARDGVLSLPFDALAIVDINGDGVPDLLMTDEQTGGGGTLYWVCGREAGTSE